MTNTTSGGSARSDGDDAPTQTLPAATPTSVRELPGFSAGVVGAALTAVGVWGLHVLTRGEGVAASVGWALLLVLAFTALGKGITLLRRALAPLSAAVLSASVAGVPPLLRAGTGIIIGAAGIWWVMRGHAGLWWAQLTGVDQQWTLPSQLVQVAIITVCGALLFGAAKTLGKLIFANSGTRDDHSPTHDSQDKWALWWSSHPGLGLLLLAGAATLVFLSGYVVPRVSGWLTGDDPMAALAAIAAILTLALLANTWWWRALSGWWTWAHTHGSGGGGASPLGQMHAGAAVIALIWFSAMGFGLASPADYTGPGAVPLAQAQCPPDCGGGSNGQGSYGPNASQFQPPQMPGQQPDYQGGINQPPLDQNSGISIYNENPAQGGIQQSQNLGPQMSGQHAAHGDPLPNYGPWQPDAQPPAQAPVQQAPQAQQPPVQQAPQAPQQPAQAPQNPAGQQPVQQAPQQPGAQQPQGQPGQQPAQQSPPQQGQPGQQPQNPANQQAPQQQPQKAPDTPKKNPMDPTDLATAATRRGSQQAGEQAAQQGTQQAVQQAPKSTTQAQQAPQTTGQSQQTPNPTQQTQQAPKETKQITGRPKGIDGAAKEGTPEKPWDITGELKPINKNFPDGSEKLGVEGRYGLQNKDPVSIGKTTMGEYSFESTFQQKLGGEVEGSAVLNPQNPQSLTNPPAALPKAEAFAGYNLENKNLISGPGVQGIITNTLKVGPSASTGPTTGTPIGATTAFQNLGGGNFYVNLPLTVDWRQAEVASTIQGVVNVPELIQGTLGKAGQWVSSGIPSVFGP